MTPDASPAAGDLTVADRAAIAGWSEAAVANFRTASLPETRGVRGAIGFPRWAGIIFVRKAREIGFLPTVRLGLQVGTNRLRGRR